MFNILFFSAIEEGGEAWKYSLRVINLNIIVFLEMHSEIVYLNFNDIYSVYFFWQPCTECLFLSLFHEYQAILTPTLLSMLNESMGLIPPHDMNSIIKKDALYNAIGLAAFELFDEVDFDRWFSKVFFSFKFCYIYWGILTILIHYY